VTASVGEIVVACQPPTLDLLVNEPPKQVQVIVPRPKLGELVPQFNHETTLYNETLRVEATADGHAAQPKEWREHVYTLEEDLQRHHIQQRVWRIGRGEDTPDDLRAEAFEQMMRRRAEEYGGGSDYDW
jgi:hypothetical protein